MVAELATCGDNANLLWIGSVTVGKMLWACWPRHNLTVGFMLELCSGGESESVARRPWCSALAANYTSLPPCAVTIYPWFHPRPYNTTAGFSVGVRVSAW